MRVSDCLVSLASSGCLLPWDNNNIKLCSLPYVHDSISLFSKIVHTWLICFTYMSTIIVSWSTMRLVLWYPVWEYMYLKVVTTHFYRLALCNLMLGLTNILLISKLFRWWLWYNRLWSFHHHRGIVRTDYIGIYSSHTLFTSIIGIDYLWTSLFNLSLFSLTVYKARF